VPNTADRVSDVLKWLERRRTKRNRDGMTRYGIVSPRAFGVSVAGLRELGRRLGRDHQLAMALWDTGWFAGCRRGGSGRAVRAHATVKGLCVFI
jgi:3-methyladenine DNA glycosylase AlkD